VAAWISATALSSLASSRPLMKITHPSRASDVAHARPRPCDEAQTMVAALDPEIHRKFLLLPLTPTKFG
jgi:hypothetical protein